MRFALILLVGLGAVNALASPVVEPGDLGLRHDIQRLADYGVITGTTSTWPLNWGPIVEDVRNFDSSTAVPADVLAAIQRVKSRAAWAMHTSELNWNARISVAEEATRIRSFQNTPRESAELSAGLSYVGESLAVVLNGQMVESPSDGEEYRADHSLIGYSFGNFMVSANTLDRWWGPGWDGSLILSNNARSIPSISIDRNFTDAFQNKWLSWLGPWDFSAHFGQLESDRHVPEARFFGMRINFRPLRSLEIGVSRTAQWCGDGRPCDLASFTDLFLGKDNIGDDDIDLSNEPGNQMAGVDYRWAFRAFGKSFATYGQFIGEDEAGGLPSRFLGQMGIEGSGYARKKWSYRWFGEFAGTSCRFYSSRDIFNCAYNHPIYRTGYRYRGRSIGHSADNDARVVTAGLVLIDDAATSWHALARFGVLNRGGPSDARQSLTPTEQDFYSLDVTRRKEFRLGIAEIGVGLESIDDIASGESRSDFRGFLQWTSAY